MTEPRTCPECDKPLPADAPAGLCPQCLLAQGLESRVSPQGASLSANGSTMHYRAPFEPPTVAEIGENFPELEIVEILGHGGMGAVYKARQPNLDRLVAVKILSPAIANDAAFAERFAREARSLAKLSHPNIVSVYDYGTRGDLCYFVMEYVDGINVRELIQGGEHAPQQALALVPQICDALQYAHDEGIVHRDIKPENILVDTNGRVKIADFGLVKIVGTTLAEVTLTDTQQVIGTWHYMAPEQVETPQEVDHRADIYAVGVVFYELLTGELPIGRFEPPSHRAEVDVRLDEVVLKSLEKAPARRYQHASQVKTDVETIRNSKPPASVARKPVRKRALSFPLYWTALSLLIGGIVFGIAFFYGPSNYVNISNYTTVFVKEVQSESGGRGNTTRQLFLELSGRGDSRGLKPNPDTLANDQLVMTIEGTLTEAWPGPMTIQMPSLGYHYRDASGQLVQGSSGFDRTVAQQWLTESGLEGFWPASSAAAAKLETIAHSEYGNIRSLANSRVFPAGAGLRAVDKLQVRWKGWVAAIVYSVGPVLWFAGLVIWNLRRRRHQPTPPHRE